MRAGGELTGATAKRGTEDLVRKRTAERLLRDGESVLVADARAASHACTERTRTLRLAAARQPLCEARSGAVVMERVRERV